MRTSDAKYVLAATFAVLLLASCGGFNPFSTPSAGQQNRLGIKHNTSSCPCLYVVNYQTNPSSISVWAIGAGGNWQQIREIKGSKTGLCAPLDVAVDGQGSLYVADNDLRSSIYVYAAGATGNVAPIRKIEGRATGLNGPSGIAFDRHKDEIYVANYGNPRCSIAASITIYPAHVHGNVPRWELSAAHRRDWTIRMAHAGYRW